MERKQFLEDCAPPGTKKSKKKKKTDVDQGTSKTSTSMKEYFLFLVDNCFHKYELATHSLTGTECPRVTSSDQKWRVQAKAKPQLDPDVLSAMMDHVAEVFQNNQNKDLKAEMKVKMKHKMVNADSWYKSFSLPSQLQGARDGYVTFMSERSNPLPTLIPLDDELGHHKKIQENLNLQSIMRRVNDSSEAS
ncbi:DNA primase DnaG [Frankliniella fusca]|uniref:DNA primase DnaG n=1 Tax=Frankliniella fusca TaxID=407009 RepID=A0AAE1LF91_9NEOP|nr:DNA primase DnaG [Frankliniella fusca]